MANQNKSLAAKLVSSSMGTRPWLGTVESYAFALQAMQYALENPGIAEAVEAETEGDDTGFEVYGDMTVRRGNLAVVTMAGPFISDDVWYAGYFGLVTYPAISRMSDALANDDSIDKVILNIDSGGGDARGIEQASLALGRLTEAKEVHTYTAGVMHSAAYWLGSQGRTISSAKMAEMGSIGVLAVHESEARFLKDLGIDVTVFRSGEYKALGGSVEELTDKAKAVIQEQNDAVYWFFIDHISTQRTQLLASNYETWAEGKTFFGEEAIAVGLSDAIGDINDLVDALQPNG
jgi:signal peptide peptidase SppA